MIVTRDTFETTLASLQDKAALAVDTETTGLRPYHGHELFSVIIYDGEQAYYFNFNDYPDLADTFKLPDAWLGEMSRLFGQHRDWYFHNAKFDLAMLCRAGIPTASGTIHDSMCVARILDSTLFPNEFSLDACAKKIGYVKQDIVKEFLLKTRCYSEEKSPGKKTTKKNFHYSLAPWDLIVPYGEKDGEITYRLAEWQLSELAAQASLTVQGLPTVRNVYENECKLVRTVFEMERRGVLIDRDFCQRAIVASEKALVDAAAEYERHAGRPFKDSPKDFQAVFETDRERWVMGDVTAGGKQNPSFDSEVLQTFQNPAAKCVLEWRKAKSDANYYHGFLYEADPEGVIHASFNQHATVHGRFSSSNPNLQNLTKDDDEDLKREFVVRRAVVPRPGNVFHMLDYDQMEYRFMLDYAARFALDDTGVKALIQKVLGGLDVHQATADVASIDRRSAKTTNFAIIYGSGLALLSNRLGVTSKRAGEIRDSIFSAAPEIRWFISRAMDAAEKRGYVVNWFGRRCRFPDARFAYRAPNYLVAGGCADIVKLAMNQIDDYLQPFRTKLVLMIHDELVLEGPPDEAATVVPAVKAIMEKAYPHRFLPLTCGVDHSFKSLADKEEGLCSTKKLSMAPAI